MTGKIGAIGGWSHCGHSKKALLGGYDIALDGDDRMRKEMITDVGAIWAVQIQVDPATNP